MGETTASDRKTEKILGSLSGCATHRIFQAITNALEGEDRCIPGPFLAAIFALEMIKDGGFINFHVFNDPGTKVYPLVIANSLLLKMAIYSEFSHQKW